MTSLRDLIGQAIFDPGNTLQRFKGDQSLTDWQLDAVMLVLTSQTVVANVDGINLPVIFWGEGKSAPTPKLATSTPARESLPDRDKSKPAEAQGLFRKFEIRRVDGSDQPGGKHHGCRYFVLDVDHDQYAAEALAAYASACEGSHPNLARDIRQQWLDVPPPTDPLQVTGGWQVVEPSHMPYANFLAGYHHAEGPGDLRIRTNDRALLDRILVLLDVYQGQRTAAKADVALGGNPLPIKPNIVDLADAEQLLHEISAELHRARAKFPAADNLTTIAMLEEAGEVAKAVLSEDLAAVRKECVQLAVMAMRIVLDGDSSTDAYRRKHHDLPPIK